MIECVKVCYETVQNNRSFTYGCVVYYTSGRKVGYDVGKFPFTVRKFIADSECITAKTNTFLGDILTVVTYI